MEKNHLYFFEYQCDDITKIFIRDDFFENYRRSIEKFDKNDLDLLERHLSSKLGGKVKINFDCKEWLLNTEIRQTIGHQAFIDKKIEVMMASLEEMPLQLDYPHPLIKAIVSWRLEIGK